MSIVSHPANDAYRDNFDRVFGKAKLIRGGVVKLFWLDLETTGLDSASDRILEIAVSEADIIKPFDAQPIYHKVLPLARELYLDPFIVNMHTKNGLLEECYAQPYHTDPDGYVEDALLKLIPVVADPSDRPVLAGSSIHFDHGFLKRHMPAVAKLFSHRYYDVSAVKLFCRSLGMEKFPRAEAHRAREDVLESIDHAKQCAEWLWSRKGQEAPWL